jgi:hypothetical protein
MSGLLDQVISAIPRQHPDESEARRQAELLHLQKFPEGRFLMGFSAICGQETFAFGANAQNL